LQEYFRILRKIDADWGKKTRQDDGRAVFRDALYYFQSKSAKTQRLNLHFQIRISID